MKVLLGPAALALFGLAATPAAAQDCTVPLRWTIEHGNGAVARMKVFHNGAELGGSGREADNSGALDGTIRGRDVQFEIEWSNGHIGVYDGSISADGRLRGVNFDKTDPASQTSWSVKQGFTCR
jgi:hypothetical protein